jgi:hypothetical protein
MITERHKATAPCGCEMLVEVLVDVTTTVRVTGRDMLHVCDAHHWGRRR